MEFEIKRSEWLRGEGQPVSKLLRSSDNKMCCLGSFSLACGVERSLILNKSAPSYIKDALYPTCDSAKLLFEISDRYRDYMSEVCHNLMETNDIRFMSDERREKTLTKYFASIGVVVKFVD